MEASPSHTNPSAQVMSAAKPSAFKRAWRKSNQVMLLPQKGGAIVMALAATLLGIGTAGEFRLENLLFIFFVFFALASETPVLALLTGWIGQKDARPRGRFTAARRIKHLRWLVAYVVLGFISAAWVLLGVQWNLGAVATLSGLATLFIGIYLLLSLRRLQRHLVAQIASILSLSLLAPAHYYVATGRFDRQVLGLWVLCALFFLGSIPYVKMRAKSLEYRGVTLLYHALSFFVVVGLIAFDVVAPLSYWGFIPVTLKAIAGALQKRTTRRINRLGIVETIVTGLFLIFTIASYAAWN